MVPPIPVAVGSSRSYPGQGVGCRAGWGGALLKPIVASMEGSELDLEARGEDQTIAHCRGARSHAQPQHDRIPQAQIDSGEELMDLGRSAQGTLQLPERAVI